jgi:kynureninase
MDALKTIESLRGGESVSWPENINTLEFAQSLDNNKDLPR